ncbi:MAG: DUF4124 domain-containing protein [Gammaproteobacteria bacterium]|nr:DUF4124 domain-containing protein [Gammaproteobacteria bacterium]MBT8123418.1 DUF4124 domain-containing protein [Gammaproteobacteria bacterium]NNC69097.1 DUF4124 domain-containing protein [Gammaproteobacteria bacterium]
MRISLAIFSVICILFCAGNAQAEIYTCKDAKGNTVYTDSPGGCANAEEVEVDTLPTLIPTKPLASSSSNRSTKKEEDKNPYTELVITSPSNEATIRDNQGNLTINFRVAPALQSRKGHKYVVTLDGAEVYSGTSTITALKNVDRGTHSISVKIVDTSGSTKISATPVKVTLQRYSALLNSDIAPSDGNGGDAGTGNGSFNFPSNTKLPTRPPPPPTSN